MERLINCYTENRGILEEVKRVKGEWADMSVKVSVNNYSTLQSFGTGGDTADTVVQALIKFHDSHCNDLIEK